MAVHVAVLVKQVPDTAAQIQIKPDRSGIAEEGLKYILSPYDEFALEEALRLKERIPETQVTAVTVGPERSKEMLRNCLAMGADYAARLWHDSLKTADPYIIALLLAKKLEGLHPELVWCGRQAVDDDMAYVGGVVAEKLNLPFVSQVTRFEMEAGGGKARVSRQIEGGDEILEVSLPCVLSAQKGLNEPRYPSLAGMMKAKKKEIEEVNALELIPKILNHVKTEVVAVEPPPKRAAGRMLSGTPEEMVRELVRALREDAKVL